MSMNNIQLKQEDVLGEQVVLTDINPVTNTESVDNSANGEKLDATIARLWQMLNNKVYRIVNSVNGRTGVVVLTSDDVGLGNVDNVSFADIKSWVINQIENAFKNKRIHFYETYAGVITTLSTNDKSLSWSPFYCDQYDDHDRRSVVGVYIWDETNSTLDVDYRLINTIGFSDNSIIYRTSDSDYNPGDSDSDYSDIPIGGIGVNIYKESDPSNQILYLEGANTASKSESGLRLAHDKIGSRLYYEDTPYGASSGSNAFPDSGYMLWKYGTSNDYKGYAVRIFLDDLEITPNYWYEQAESDVIDGTTFFIDNRWTHYNTFRNNDVIIMRFAQLMLSNSYPFSKGMCQDFSNRQPSIGTVCKADPTDDADYIIKFYALNPNTNGYGITTLETHQDRDSKSTQLGVDIAKSDSTPDGMYDTNEADPLGNALDINMSGLNTICGTTPITSTKNPVDTSLTDAHIVTPWGESIAADNGIYIIGDSSICTYPKYQAVSTIRRQGKVPNWIENTYYSKSGSTYTLTTSKPADWSYRFYSYFTKNPDDTYSHVTGTIPAYTDAQVSHGKEYPNKNVQVCIGSMMASNFALNNTSPFYTDKGIDPTNPIGLDPSSGLGGTVSNIGVNLRKFSSSMYIDARNGNIHDQDHFRIKAGYQFFNLSGLKINPIQDSSYIDYKDKFPLDLSLLESLGMPDFVDVNGRNLSGVQYPGDVTAGLSINNGKFLEITPEQTYRAEKYWEGGKVQVRIGKGLTEQFDEIDITDMILTRSVPSSYNFDYAYLEARFITNTEEFYKQWGENQYPFVSYHQPLEGEDKPDNWDTEWYKYEYNIGTTEYPDYVFLPYDATNPVGYGTDEANYMGPYYIHGMECDSLEDVRERIESGGLYSQYRYIWKRPTNRITLKLDPNTLGYNEQGRLTIVGGIPDENTAETTNIRFIDTGGYYADTYHGEEAAHTECITVGEGLKLIGSDICFPDDMRLPTAVNKYNLKLKDIFDNGLSTYELCVFVDKMAYRFGVTPPSKYTLNWLRANKSTFSSMIQSLPVTVDTTTTTSDDVENSYQNDLAAGIRSLLSDSGNLTYGDARYNIPEAQYPKSVYRKYIAGTMDEIQSRATDIIKSIPLMIDDASNVSKIEQYVADHYNIGTITSNDQLVNAIPNIRIFTPGSTTESYLPLDWLFAFFTKTVLLGGEWSKIVAGEFVYTQLASRPNGWEPNGYASYFVHDAGANVYNVLTANSPRYYAGIYYTRDGSTGDMTLVTSDSETTETILTSYYIRNYFVPVNAEPANWGTDWNSYYVTSDVTTDKRYVHVDTDTAPVWEANKYYRESAADAQDVVIGYEKVTSAPAFVVTERGTATNYILRAPDWAADTYCNDDETLQTERPVDWFTNYASYLKRFGEEGSYSYAAVVGVETSIKTYVGPYYTRALDVPTS